MPRHAKGPRLWLDPRRKQWVIRDGSGFIRTGCPHGNAELAQKLLAKYIAKKYAPPRTDNPPVADILLAYLQKKIPEMKGRSSAKYNISGLAQWWGDKTLADVTPDNCKAYAATKTRSMGRSDLERLGAAINFWHREVHPLALVPSVWKPPRNESRDRWLTRSEAARLLWACRRTEHLKRFVMIGLHTGSRSGVIKRLEWSWIDFSAGTMRRRARGEAETRNKRTPPVRIPRKLMHFLRRWKAKDSGLCPFVVHYNGRPIKRDPHRAWTRALRLAGLEGDGVMIHTLRHTKATWLVQAGIDLWQAAGFLGMTVRMLEATYGHHSPDWQKDAADI